MSDLNACYFLVHPAREAIRICDDERTIKSLKSYGWEYSGMIKIEDKIKPDHFMEMSYELAFKLLDDKGARFLKLHRRRLKDRLRRLTTTSLTRGCKAE